MRCSNTGRLLFPFPVLLCGSALEQLQSMRTSNTGMFLFPFPVLLCGSALEQQQSLQAAGFAGSLRASCQQNLYDIYHCRVYSEELLMIYLFVPCIDDD